jgi:hypothetical protein
VGKVTFTTKGYIEVWWTPSTGPVYVSRHRTEAEAIESLTAHAATVPGGGDQLYEIRFPGKLVRAYGITNPSGDTTAPSVPANLAGDGSSATRVQLTWSASTDDVGVTGYQVYRNSSPVGTTTGTSYADTGRSPATTYQYSVSAYDAAGNNSAPCTAIFVTTRSNAAPVWVVGQQELTTNVGYSLVLTSVCSDADGDPLVFSVQSGALPTGVSLVGQQLSGTCAAVQTATAVLRASDGITYTDQSIVFRVLNADTTAPSVPTGLAGSAYSRERIDLSWALSSDPSVTNARTSGLQGYRLYRDGLLRTSLGAAALAYSDEGLAANTLYSYRLSAFDAANNESAQCAAVAVTSLPGYPAEWTDGLGDTFSVAANQPFSYTFQATDSDADAIVFAFTNADTGLSFVETQISPTVRQLTISGTAGAGGASQSVTVDFAASAAWGLDSTTAMPPEGSRTLPAPLDTYYDDQFGNTPVKRMIDPSTVTDAKLRPTYSNLQAWNSDGTLLLLLGDDFPHVVDAATGALRINTLRKIDGEAFVRWSPDEPYVLYWASNGNGSTYTSATFGKYTINPADWTYTSTALVTWPGYAKCTADCNSAVVRGNDGKLRVPLVAANVTPTGPYYVRTYNITDNALSSVIDVQNLPSSSQGSVPEAYITPSGANLALLWGPGSLRTDGLELFTLDGTFVRQVTTLGGHQDLIRDSAGVEWVVMFDNSLLRVFKSRLDGGGRVDLLQLPTWTAYDGIHISARATSGYTSDADQFVVVSSEVLPGTTFTAFTREVWMVYMNSTLLDTRVRRLCHTRSPGLSNGGTLNGYNDDQPHATVKHDGSEILFGSNWERTNGSKDAFVVSVP